MMHNYIVPVVFTIIIGTNGSASHHPVGHSFHQLSQPGVTQPGVTQLGVAQRGVMQLGVPQPGVIQPGLGVPQQGVMTQWRVVQQGAPQLHNAPQRMAAGFWMSRSKFYTIPLTF